MSFLNSQKKSSVLILEPRELRQTHILPLIYKHIAEARSANNTFAKSLHQVTLFQLYQIFIRTLNAYADITKRLCGDQLTLPMSKKG